MRHRSPSLIVLACLLFGALSAVPHLYAQKESTLKSFYIAAHVFSDYGPTLFEYILDVQPEGSGSRVRHLRLAPASIYCPSVLTIRAIQKTVASPPDSLLGGVNLCSMVSKTYNETIKRFTRRNSYFEAEAYTVVASCGAMQKAFDMPYLEQLDLDGLRKASPSVAHVVDLYSAVLKRISPVEPINGEKHPKDYELQVAAEPFLPDLRSGRFDAGFSKDRLKEMLVMYRGPVRTEDPQPVLLDNKWTFVKFINPVYPPLARQARIQSKVQLELVVNEKTGEITDAKVLSGHPLLNQGALDAVRQWVFSTNQNLPEKMAATLDYSIGCKLVQ